MNYLRAFVLVLLSLFASFASAQTMTRPPNTSANPITPAFSNGNLAGNVNLSHLNVHQLLYAGSTTQVMVHYLGWFDGGNDSGINVNYANTDPTYINNFFFDIQWRGVDGVIVDWQGQNDLTNQSWLAAQPIIKNYNSANTGSPMTYMIMLDANLLNNYTGTNQQKVVAAMNYITAQYLSDTNYSTYNGKKVVADFGLTAAGGINWTTLQNSFPSVTFVHLDNATSPDGFGIASSGGSFLWVNSSDTSLGSAPDLSYIDDFYTRAAQHPSQIAIGATFKGFDPNPYATWDSPFHYTDQQCGQTWLNTFNKINQHFNSSNQLPFLQLATWDDYYEGTTLETGIDSCLQINGSVSGRTINVSWSGSGNMNTVQYVVLWTYANGAWSYVWYPSTTTSITLPPGDYYIQSLGKPMFKSTLSQQLIIN